MNDEKPRCILHCWEDGPRTTDDVGTTCMLPKDHLGTHRWTRDDRIGVSFAETPNAD